MRCNSCGKDVPDDEVVFDTTNVATGPGGKYAYTQTAPVWFCKECAEFRKATFRFLCWIAGVVLLLAAIAFAVDFLS